MFSPAATLAACLALTCQAAAQPPAPSSEQPDWRQDEAALFTNAVQITSRDQFLKAGEAYFDHEESPAWIIFQAIPVPPRGAAPDPFYSMYVAKLKRDDSGRITGTDTPILVSPAGSANTCGWFHPHESWRILFGSTLTRPSDTQRSGFQVGTRRYVWQFPEEMEIVTRNVPQIAEDVMPGCPMNDGIRAAKDAENPAVLFERSQYDAECSYSPCGRFVLYAHVREPKNEHDRPDADIWIYDTRTAAHHPIVEADGYDGGPFFSPCGKKIVYRSDRRADDRLQLFIAELRFDADGVPVGISREIQITDDNNVNWAPYWHPSGSYIVYGTNAIGHHNYEVFAIAADPEKPISQRRTRRLTFAPGADILPVFSADGSLMMWTSQRGPAAPGEERPSSQVWIAQCVPGATESAAALFR